LAAVWGVAAKRARRGSLIARMNNPVVDLLVTLFSAVAIAYVVQLWFVKPYRVPTGSMEPTLHVSDRILAARFVYHLKSPSRGEILVFHPNGRDGHAF